MFIVLLRMLLMRFKQFITEEGTQAQFTKLHKLFETSYSEAFKSKTTLWRGIEDTSDYKEPYDFRDNSKFQDNRRQKGDKPIFLETMIAICPEWKNFPNRLRSFMITTSLAEAEGFGTPYRVFPINKAKLAIAPTDFNYYKDWPMLKKYFDEDIYIHRTMPTTFLPQIYALMTDPKDLSDDRPPRYEEEIKTWFDKHHKEAFAYFKKHYIGKKDLMALLVKKIIQTRKLHPDGNKHMLNRLLTTFESQTYLKVLEEDFNGDLQNMFETLFSPSENNFEVIKISELDAHAKEKHNEIWTEDKCLFVSEEDFAKHHRMHTSYLD